MMFKKMMIKLLMLPFMVALLAGVCIYSLVYLLVSWYRGYSLYGYITPLSRLRSKFNRK